MSKKLYVGNLSYGTQEDSLKDLFAQFGEVISCVIISDRNTRQSKGFGFVEFAEDAAADAAIEGLNGQQFDGRQLRVNVAEDKPRERREFRPRNNDRAW